MWPENNPANHKVSWYQMNTFGTTSDDNWTPCQLSVLMKWQMISRTIRCIHDDVIKWKHFLRYWPFVRGIHRSPVNSPHKGQWRGVLMFSLIFVWINGWVNNREAGDLRRYRAHYDVILMDHLFLREMYLITFCEALAIMQHHCV